MREFGGPQSPHDFLPAMTDRHIQGDPKKMAPLTLDVHKSEFPGTNDKLHTSLKRAFISLQNHPKSN